MSSPRSSGAPPSNQPIVFVVGPTASGKTALAVALAETFDGEIVNADSRQFYRGMEIGTAKPTPEERARAVHHLIDIAEPDEVWGLALFLDHADAAIAEIRRRGRLPIVCGGTGQYVRGLLEGWQVPHVPPDPALRATLEERLARDGVAALAADLLRISPGAAARIDLKNPRRVIRALEIATVAGSGAPPTAGERPPIGRALVLGIAMAREELYARIDARVDTMFAAGLVEEVRALTSRGKGCGAFAFTAIGYREVCRFLRGETTLDQAREATKLATHRLARTQAGWFRRSDPRITWLEAGPRLAAEARAITAAFLRERPPGDEAECSS